jgi:hypothetical protein
MSIKCHTPICEIRFAYARSFPLFIIETTLIMKIKTRYLESTILFYTEVILLMGSSP